MCRRNGQWLALLRAEPCPCALALTNIQVNTAYKGPVCGVTCLGEQQEGFALEEKKFMLVLKQCW